MRFHRFLVIAVIAACGDSLRPADVLGTYSLVTIQGHAPPQIVVDAPDCRITVIGGSLTLSQDQRFELLLEEVSVCPTPTEPGELAEGWGGTYSLEGGTVVLHAVGDPSVDYHARFRDGRLVVPLGSRYGDVAFTPP
jgi:hypothetical protein